jgi:tRNA-Thr(GGU) m(6)t(6)A37 methyltransferase TsaA
MKLIIFKPIGVIHSPVKSPAGAPREESTAGDVTATIEIYSEYAEGLTDLEGFSHIILLTYFHLSKDFSLMVKPPLDEVRHGVFATRSPRRPNPIGMSTVRLIKIDGNILHITNTEMIDGTPVLDIKPYIPLNYLKNGEIRIGWLAGKIKE